MSVPLTARQAEVLAAIRELSASGLAPTLRELGAKLGIKSTNGVACHLKALEKKGHVKLFPGAARGVALFNVTPEEWACGYGRHVAEVCAQLAEASADIHGIGAHVAAQIRLRFGARSADAEKSPA